MDSDTNFLALPTALRARANPTANGEYLWPYEIVLDVIDWIAAQGMTVLAVEEYEPRGPMRTNFRASWSTPVRRRTEPWSIYVWRVADYAKRIIRELESAEDRPLSNLFFFLAVCSEPEYREMRRRVP
jgi:hypothetical protein